MIKGNKPMNWILCEDRMPTEIDGDSQGNVLWANTWDHSSINIAPWYNPEAVMVYSHWQTLPDKPKK